MTQQQLIAQVLKQSPYLAFNRENLRKIEKRQRSAKSVYVHFGYQWKDSKGTSRGPLARSLKEKLEVLCKEVSAGIPASNHKVNFAPLRGEAGTYLLQKIMVDIMSGDILVFDLTHRNPNVLFELGIAYAMGRRFFLIVQEDSVKDVPSDLAGLTISRYKGKIESFSSSSTLRDLKKAIRKVIKQKIKLRR